MLKQVVHIVTTAFKSTCIVDRQGIRSWNVDASQVGARGSRHQHSAFVPGQLNTATQLTTHIRHVISYSTHCPQNASRLSQTLHINFRRVTQNWLLPLPFCSFPIPRRDHPNVFQHYMTSVVDRMLSGFASCILLARFRIQISVWGPDVKTHTFMVFLSRYNHAKN
jgi:hypothetical protein